MGNSHTIVNVGVPRKQRCIDCKVAFMSTKYSLSTMGSLHPATQCTVCYNKVHTATILAQHIAMAKTHGVFEVGTLVERQCIDCKVTFSTVEKCNGSTIPLHGAIQCSTCYGTIVNAAKMATK